MSNRYLVPCAYDTVWVARAIARYRLWVIRRRWDQLAGISLPGDNAVAPLVFLSALDAEILMLSDMPATHWRRRELAECCIPRNPYVHDGELHLMLVIGFAASLAHRLDVVDCRLSPMYLPLHFEVEDHVNLTLNFPRSQFAFVEQRWAALGAEDHPRQVHRLNDSDDDRLRALAIEALAAGRFSHQPHGDRQENWAVFDSQTRRWRIGARWARQPGQLH